MMEDFDEISEKRKKRTRTGPRRSSCSNTLRTRWQCADPDTSLCKTPAALELFIHRSSTTADQTKAVRSSLRLETHETSHYKNQENSGCVLDS